MRWGSRSTPDSLTDILLDHLTNSVTHTILGFKYSEVIFIIWQLPTR